MAGAHYRDATLDNLETACENQRSALQRIRDYEKHLVDHVRRGVNIVLHGPCGTGKDHFIISLAKRALITHGIMVEAVFGQELFAQRRDEIDEGASERAFIQRYLRPAVLYVSDPIPMRGELTDYQANLLLRIVEKRYFALKPIWISINVDNYEGFSTSLGEATAQRLIHNAVTISCSWPSYRRAALANNNQGDENQAN